MIYKNKKIIISSTITLLILIIGTICIFKNKESIETNKIQATILFLDNKEITVQDKNNIIYTFKTNNMKANTGEKILIEYTGLLDKNKNIQNCIITKYTTSLVSKNEDGIPTDWLDEGLFSKYYTLANNKLKTLTLDEKIGQLLLVRYPDNNQIEELKKYKFAGYIFFEKDFQNKTESEVKNMINNLQKTTSIPILTAVDEEGGRVVRVSSNPNLAKEAFKSPSQLYIAGGFNAIKDDTINKSKILKNLGLNLNLAPVVDVSTNPSDYIYNRTIGLDTSLTSTYAKSVIEASKNTGVSYTLKHFPGYGNNTDTHLSSSIDTRSYDDIVANDLPPFKSGIGAGAEAVLVSHNIINSIDHNNPASLSPSIHNLLRDDLNFTGIIITDDIAMSAVSSISDTTVKAILAGNDLIITTDYIESINSIKSAINDGTISEDLIDKLAFRVLAWKYYKGLMFENQK